MENKAGKVRILLLSLALTGVFPALKTWAQTDDVPNIEDDTSTVESVSEDDTGFASTAQDELLRAIQSGEIEITPEMIEAQKAMNPALKVYTNDEIREKLRQRAQTYRPRGQRRGQPRGRTVSRQTRQDSIDRADSLKKEARESADTRFPSNLKRFGYDFFSSQSNSQGSGGNQPSLPEYVLSPGDELQISLWGRENRTQRVIIDNEGMIAVSPLQPTRIGGMKFSDAQQLITRELEKINGVQSSISMGRLRSIRIFLVGEVNKPGAYVIPGGTTITGALFQSGGVKEIGSLRGIQLRRNGSTISNLDLYDMLLFGNNRGDRQLVAGDAVFVPVAKIQVALSGLVKRPGIYELKPGTKAMAALDLAGGLASNAFKGRVRLDRIENHQRKVVLDIPMENISASRNAVLQDGDMLNVEEVLSKEFDVVYLKGNVNRPGRYEFKKGMSVRDLIPTPQDLKSESYFNYGHIKRTSGEDERPLLLPFSLKDMFEKKSAVPLEPRDTIMVYSRYDIMDQPRVSVWGLVRKSGHYGYVDQMRVSDLILVAGGLKIEAYLPEAHLLRVLKVHESDSLRYNLTKVNLSGIIDNPGDENNVELKPFDSLMVFPRSNFILPKKVMLFGAVKNQDTFELAQNMGIRELISQAQGLTKDSYKLSVEVVRRNVQGDSLVVRDIRQVSLNELVEGRTKFDLEDGDAVYVREVVNSHERKNIVLSGQFRFPGRYEFKTGERLSSVIRRAGGFTPDAFLRGVVFIRKSVKEQQLRHVEEIGRRLQNQMQIMLDRTTDEKERIAIQAAIEQRRSILTDVRKAPYLGRVVSKLDMGLAFAGTDWDITLEDSDSLWVGAQVNTVSILGEVFSPTNVVFTKESNTVGKCVSTAGGINEFGDKSSTYYIHPDGTVQTPRNTSFFFSRKVEPGGSIIVPPQGPKTDYLDALAKITQIIYQTAISVGVVKTLF